MQTAIRNADGTLISDGVWSAIKLSSRQITESLLSIETTSRNATRSKTKQFFKSYYSAEWREGITQLEELQPLLQLCAAHWKAEHVLGSTLTSVNHNASRSSSKRPAQDHQTQASKKPRQDQITVNAIRTMHERNGKTPDLTVSSTDGEVTPLLYGGKVLGSAVFSRKLNRSSSSTGTTTTTQLSNGLSSATSLDSLRPSAVDPSCQNLIGKCFRYHLSS